MQLSARSEDTMKRRGGFMMTDDQDKTDIRKKEEPETTALEENEQLSKDQFIEICHRIFDQIDDVNKSLTNR